MVHISCWLMATMLIYWQEAYMHLVGIFDERFSKFHYFCQGQLHLWLLATGTRNPAFPLALVCSEFNWSTEDTGETAPLEIELDHAWHCYCQAAIGPCMTLLLSDSNWTMRDIANIWQQLDHVWHCYCQTAIGPCVTLLISDSNWTMCDTAIVRQHKHKGRQK